MAIKKFEKLVNRYRIERRCVFMSMYILHNRSMVHKTNREVFHRVPKKRARKRNETPTT